LAEAGADWIVMDVGAMGEEVFAVAHATVGKAALPNRKLRAKAVGEAAFDELNCTLKSNALWRDQQMDVVGHEDEGVELVVAFAAVVLEGFEEEVGGGFNLEEASALVGLGGDEESAVACCSGGDSHDG